MESLAPRTLIDIREACIVGCTPEQKLFQTRNVPDAVQLT